MPNLNDRLPRMPSDHVMGVTNEGWAPDIQGTFKVIYHLNEWNNIASGSFQPQGNVPSATLGGGSYCGNYTIGFMASRSSSCYNGNVRNIMARNLCMRFLIKYI